MSRRLRVVSLILVAIVLLIAAGVLLAYRSSQYVPPFYRDAIAVDLAVQRHANDQVLQQATALASDLQKRGHWAAVFTAEQINGWLAVDLVENYRDSLPPEIEAPRVDITSTAIILACRLHWGGVSSVVSLTVEPYMAGANVLALRFRSARAGRLPIPLRRGLDAIDAAARDSNLQVKWRQADGDLVAMLSILPPRDVRHKTVRLEMLRLEAGKIYVAGSTE